MVGVQLILRIILITNSSVLVGHILFSQILMGNENVTGLIVSLLMLRQISFFCIFFQAAQSLATQDNYQLTWPFFLVHHGLHIHGLLEHKVKFLFNSKYTNLKVPSTTLIGNKQ